MILKTPQSLKAEHDELHAQLAQAKDAGGATGEAAAKVAKALHPHFLKEEEYALPPLMSPGDFQEFVRVRSCRAAILNLADSVNETCPYGHTTNAFAAILRVCSGAVRRFPAILRIAGCSGFSLTVRMGKRTIKP